MMISEMRMKSSSMAFSEILGFSQILSKSIKLVLKNGKSIAAITTLSILPSSFLFLIFRYFYQSAMTYITDTIMNSTSAAVIITLQIILCFVLIFSFELCILAAIIAIAQASGIATILAIATSYNISDTKLSLQDLFSMVKTKWRRPFAMFNNSSRSRNYMMINFLFIAAVAVGVPLVMFNPINPIIIAVAIVAGVSFLVFQLYASVPSVMAAVIPVVEEGCEAVVERAEKLVQGQRIDGFMLNLVLNGVGLIVLSGLWMIVGDKGSLNFVVYAFFLIIYGLLTRIFGSVLYTVYYFQCKEYHGEDAIQLAPNFNYYSTVPNNEIP